MLFCSIFELEKVFKEKDIVAVSFFQNCAIHPYSSFISFPLIENIQARTSFLFIFIHVQGTDIVVSTAQTDLGLKSLKIISCLHFVTSLKV